MPSPSEELSLSEAVTHLLTECRMILPGLQTLFGFQLIAVFSDRFDQQLSRGDQHLHLLALTLVAIAVALVMTPAAYHRLRHPQAASRQFLLVGGRLLVAALVPLMLGVSLDFYLIASIILGQRSLSMALAGGLIAVFAGLWFVFPRLLR